CPCSAGRSIKAAFRPRLGSRNQTRWVPDDGPEGRAPQVAGLDPTRGDLLVVAASIMIIGGVQRLVQVTDEMKQELKCHDLLFEIGGGICQFLGELLDLVDRPGRA